MENAPGLPTKASMEDPQAMDVDYIGGYYMRLKEKLVSVGTCHSCPRQGPSRGCPSESASHLGPPNSPDVCLKKSSDHS